MERPKNISYRSAFCIGLVPFSHTGHFDCSVCQHTAPVNVFVNDALEFHQKRDLHPFNQGISITNKHPFMTERANQYPPRCASCRRHNGSRTTRRCFQTPPRCASPDCSQCRSVPRGHGQSPRETPSCFCPQALLFKAPGDCSVPGRSLPEAWNQSSCFSRPLCTPGKHHPVKGVDMRM